MKKTLLILLIMTISNPEVLPFSIKKKFTDIPKENHNLKILTWNIYMLPYCNLINHNHKRAGCIADKLTSLNYDIIIFQEAFDKGSRNIIIRKLKSLYPYMYGPANISGFSLKTSSGIWVLSRIPLRKLGEIQYKSRFGMDAMARKGAVLFEGFWNGINFQLMGTHLQADSPDNYRREQCKQINDELLSKYSRKDVPQIMCGDFNIEHDDDPNYKYMLSELQAEDGNLYGNTVSTYDEQDNTLARRMNGKKRKLDYVLSRNTTQRPISIHQNISILKSKINRRISDLSDHYGIEASISFR